MDNKKPESSNPENNKMSSNEKKPESTGKRRVHVIQSRYMQQKSDATILQKRSTPVLSTTITAKGSGARPKATMNLSVTPRMEPAPKKNHSSTPTTESSKIEIFDCDVSSISLISKIPAVPSMKTALGPAFSEGSKVTHLKKFHESPGKTKPKALRPTQAISAQLPSTIPIKSKANADSAQNFDLLYSKEVLLAYRLQEQQEALEKNISESLAQLWALHLKNSELMKQETDLVNEVHLRTHQLQMHEFLTEQINELQRTVPDYSVVQKRLAAITDSLEQCQSEIPTRNIKLPEKEDDIVTCMETLNSALSGMLEGNQSLRNKLNDLGSLLPDIRSSLSSAGGAMTRSEELAAKLDQLSNKEASIIIQRIQEITSTQMTLDNPKWMEYFTFL